jgi:hypothetical protein
VTVRITESRLPAGYLASELGQTREYTSAEGAKYVLVAFLTSPIRKQTFQEYVVFVIDGEADEYRWTVRDSAGQPVTVRDSSGQAVTTATTEFGSFSCWYANTGLHTIRVEVMVGGTVAATLEMPQMIRTPSFILEDIFAAQDAGSLTGFFLLRDHRSRDVLRELWNDFNLYIEDAADATGLKGVPPRLVAAILARESWARPKRGTSGEIDVVAAGEAWKVRETQHDELATTYDLLGDALPASLGPGQLLQPTVAALEGLITWREGAAAGTIGLSIDRKFVQYLNVADFIGLVVLEQVDVFNLARFPKSNIKLVAKLLARLKNRAHRWPDVLRTDVLDSANTSPDQLVGIVASEYNIGPTLTHYLAAEENRYGEIISATVVTPSDDFALFQ